MNDPYHVASESTAAKSEGEKRASLVRWMLAALVMVCLCGCTVALCMARKFGPIFDDLLLDSQSLPPFTGLVIHLWMPLLGFVWLLAAAAIFWIFAFRRALHAVITALSCAVVLGGAACLTVVLLLFPLMDVIQNHGVE